MITLKDISVRCKCSVATVSKALNGMPDISRETAQHIRQVASQMGYMPNAAARTLKTNRSHTVGLLMCQRDENIWTHDFFSTVAAGIQEVMEQSGYDVTPINSQRLETLGEVIQYCVYRGYDGIVVMSAGFHREEMQKLLESKLPMVSIGKHLSPPGRGAFRQFAGHGRAGAAGLRKRPSEDRLYSWRGYQRDPQPDAELPRGLCRAWAEDSGGISPGSAVPRPQKRRPGGQSAAGAGRAAYLHSVSG